MEGLCSLDRGQGGSSSGGMVQPGSVSQLSFQRIICSKCSAILLEIHSEHCLVCAHRIRTRRFGQHCVDPLAGRTQELFDRIRAPPSQLVLNRHVSERITCHPCHAGCRHDSNALSGLVIGDIVLLRFCEHFLHSLCGRVVVDNHTATFCSSGDMTEWQWRKLVSRGTIL